MKADMHVHTRASDGLFNCEDAVNEAIKAGLGMLVITDHDSAYNSKKAIECCKNAGLKSTAGIEISAYVDDVKIHTLGYGFDPDDAGFRKFCKSLRDGSYTRTEDILGKLKKCGVHLTFEEVAAECISPETPIHVMHICRAAVKKGYDKDVNPFFYKYMMYGAPAFSNICRPTPEEAIQVVLSAGGMASVAHPGRISMEKNALYSLIAKLSAEGLGGIEAVYSAHTVAETEYYKGLAEEFGLLVTGGSDTHFAGGNRQVGTPAFTPSEALLERLKID